MAELEAVIAQEAVEAELEEELSSTSMNYFNWRELFPELQILYENIPILQAESASIDNWKPWPEDHYFNGSSADWTVFPFLHTFPATDTSKSRWIESTTTHCSETTRLLQQIPNIRTALYSRLGPGTKLSSHTGWADLANYVLRCHICAKVPSGRTCGMIVDGETQYHEQGEILVFDDSKKHKAFNESEEERVVLIVDMLRPSHLALGTARGGHTDELDSFIDQFR